MIGSDRQLQIIQHCQVNGPDLYTQTNHSFTSFSFQLLLYFSCFNKFPGLFSLFPSLLYSSTPSLFLIKSFDSCIRVPWQHRYWFLPGPVLAPISLCHATIRSQRGGFYQALLLTGARKKPAKTEWTPGHRGVVFAACLPPPLLQLASLMRKKKLNFHSNFHTKHRKQRGARVNFGNKMMCESQGVKYWPLEKYAKFIATSEGQGTQTHNQGHWKVWTFTASSLYSNIWSKFHLAL